MRRHFLSVLSSPAAKKTKQSDPNNQKRPSSREVSRFHHPHRCSGTVQSTTACA